MATVIPEWETIAAGFCVGFVLGAVFMLVMISISGGMRR